MGTSRQIYLLLGGSTHPQLGHEHVPPLISVFAQRAVSCNAVSTRELAPSLEWMSLTDIVVTSIAHIVWGEGWKVVCAGRGELKIMTVWIEWRKSDCSFQVRL